MPLRFHTLRVLGAALLAVLLGLSLALPTAAEAAAFTFGGDNSFKIQSGGKVDPWQVGVTGTSAGTGDMLMDYYVGLYNFNLFDAIGTSDVEVGDSFTGPELRPSAASGGSMTPTSTLLPITSASRGRTRTTYPTPMRWPAAW